MAWFDDLPAELTFEQNGTKLPVKEHPFVKESTDLPHFVNRALEQHHEVGARVPVKKLETPEAITEWRKTHLPKFYETGLLDKPPASPDEYEIKKPAELVDGLLWSDENAVELGRILHKHGVPKTAAQELLALHTKTLIGNQTMLKAEYDTGITALKTEFGDKYDETFADAQRLTALIFKNQDEVDFFERTQLGNHPGFLSVLMRLSKFAKQDSSILPPGGSPDGTGATAEQVRSEVADIMYNPSNPKNKLFYQRDPATLQYIDELYKKAYGTGQVLIS